MPVSFTEIQGITQLVHD